MSGINRCQGMPWREELNSKELRGALGGERDLELGGSTVFWNIVDLESSFNIYYKCGSMRILKGWCSSFVPL